MLLMTICPHILGAAGSSYRYWGDFVMALQDFSSQNPLYIHRRPNVKNATIYTEQDRR
jgi:hypothetical protein